MKHQICTLMLGLSLMGCAEKTIQQPEPAADAKPAANGAAGAPAEPDQKDPESIFGAKTNEVVDMKNAMAENPDLVVVENKINAGDPISQSLQAYVSLRSRASTLGMEHAIKTHKALHDRNPTYGEFMKIMKDNRIEFTKLYVYQKYGYDAETGAIVVLEDKADKARRYKQAGIPLDEEEK